MHSTWINEPFSGTSRRRGERVPSLEALPLVESSASFPGHGFNGVARGFFFVGSPEGKADLVFRHRIPVGITMGSYTDKYAIDSLWWMMYGRAQYSMPPDLKRHGFPSRHRNVLVYGRCRFRNAVKRRGTIWPTWTSRL